MKKRFLSIFLILVMVFSLMSATAFAADTVVEVADKDALTSAIQTAADSITIKLLQDVELNEKLDITVDVTIEGEHTITRANNYTDTLFEVNAGATLTLDGGLTIDGGNAWTYTKMPPDMDMANGDGTYVGNHITPAEGGVNATAGLIVNKGTLNANKVTIENSYSTNGVSAIDCGANSKTILDGATMQNIAANRSGAVVYVGGADAVLTIKGDTRITGNFGIGNGGIIQNYGQGTTVNMEDGSIDNNHIGKSGTLYASYSSNASKMNTFNMSGGVITQNVMEGYGPVYIHTNTVWNMTGGEISKNISYLPSYVRGNNNALGNISGGKIVNNEITGTNYSNGYYVTRPDIYLGVTGNITGGEFTQDVSEYCALGYAPVNNGDGTWSVDIDPEEAVCEMDGEYFLTIKDALDTLKSSDTEPHTLTILKDYEIDVNYSTYNYPILVNGFTVELDLNGKTITADWSKYTGSRKDNALIGLANGGKLTVIDSSEEQTGTIRNMSDGKDDVENRIFWLSNAHATKEEILTIEGGNFIQEDDINLLYVEGVSAGQTKAGYFAYINGGNFQMIGYNDFFNSYDGRKQETIISGGTFNVDPTDWETKFPAGYIAAEETDGVWSIQLDTEKTFVAKTGNGYYETIQEAIAAAEVSGNPITLLNDVELSETLVIDETMTIDGAEAYTISAADDFIGSNLIELATAGKTLTLEDVTLDGNAKCRVIKASAGNLVLNNATVTNGKSGSYVGGVFVTEEATISVSGGSIKGNTSAQTSEYYESHSQDLWIGSEASGTVGAVSNGAQLGEVFVNANSYGDGTHTGLTIDGATIDCLYIEYDDDKGAIVDFQSGTITKMLVSTTTTGTAVEVSAEAGNTYTGGQIPVASVTLDKETLNLATSHTSTLNATVTPDVATNKTVSWTTSDERVATVDENGKVTAVAAGTAIITATADGKSDTCTVTVFVPYYGGGSGTRTYSVITKKTENGSVTVSAANAADGTTVTITAKPDKGYTLETLSVTDNNGKQVKLTAQGNGKYTFKMPASKVTVEATFMDDNTMLNYFVDVFASDYYYDAVLWAVENGITTGTSSMTFSPNAVCTRAQVVTFLWRAAGSPEPVGAANGFDDVAPNAYYAKAVQWAVEQGITLGTGNNKFSPDAECTRSQIVTFLWRSQGSKKATANNPFVDVAKGAYYEDAVLWAVEEAITNGTGVNTFGPDAKCTRGQIVTFLYRCLGDKK